MHRTLRRLLLALGTATLAVTLTGCVNLKSFTGSQTTPIGGVQIVSVLCVSNPADCPSGGNSSLATPTLSAASKIQTLIGYRVSAGSTPPADLRFFDDNGQGPLFSQSPSYTAELQRLAPAPAGQQWFGYLSSPYALTPTLTTVTIFTRFGMPVAADGTPVSTYTYLVVVGGRQWTDAPSATRPVACGDSLTTINVGDATICIDSPAPSDVTSWKTLAVRDLGVAAGPTQSVARGQTASVPFTLKTSAGIAPGTQATLSATTTLAGASAAVTPGTLALASSATAGATVAVAVPAGAAPGTYPVTLTATVGTDVRTAEGAITIPVRGGPGGTAGLPTVSNLSITPKSIFRSRGAQPATLKVTLSEPGTLSVAVARVARGRRNLAGRCVAPKRSLIRNGAPKCTRFIPVTTIVKANQGAGVRSVTFSGRRRTPGVYRLSVTVRAGGLLSVAKTISVTVQP